MPGSVIMSTAVGKRICPLVTLSTHLSTGGRKRLGQARALLEQRYTEKRGEAPVCVYKKSILPSGT